MMNPACIQALKSWLDAGLGFFYPEVCQVCRRERATVQEGFVGGNCSNTVEFIKPPFCERCGLPFEGSITNSFECANCRELELAFSFARAAVPIKGVVREVIHKYKYTRSLWFEPFLADLLIRAASPMLRYGDWDLIIPVPLHPLKQSEREFNQAERLSKCLAKATGIEMDSRSLLRVLPTRTQTRLSRPERSANVRRAFSLRDSGVVKGRRVVLVDDVLTTGATTSACASALLRGGAEAVCAWTVARGLIH